jgi:hypothetical protein
MIRLFVAGCGWAAFSLAAACAGSTGGGAPAPSAATPPAGERLGAEEIRRTHFGNTVEGRSPNGATWRAHVTEAGDARIKGTNARGNAIDDSGRWVTRDDTVCIRWQRIREGRERCFSVFREGTTYTQHNADGSLNATYEIRPGNPHGL